MMNEEDVEIAEEEDVALVYCHLLLLLLVLPTIRFNIGFRKEETTESQTTSQVLPSWCIESYP